MIRLPLIATLTLASAAPAFADRRARCFDGPPAVAANAHHDLRYFRKDQDFWDGKSPLPSGKYGRCTIKDSVLYDGRGRKLATLHCGIVVERRGLVDHLGLEVGTTGKQVIERSFPDKNEKLVCTAYTGGSRCMYVHPHRSEPVASWIVGRALKDNVRLTGEKAERFFRGQKIKKIFMTGNCH